MVNIVETLEDMLQSPIFKALAHVITIGTGLAVFSIKRYEYYSEGKTWETYGDYWPFRKRIRKEKPSTWVECE